jgi:RNA recognition motif-containing protein
MSVGHLYTRAYPTFIGEGRVVSVKIVQDRQRGQPRDTAFVEMSTPGEDRRVVSLLNRQDSMGKILMVRKATEECGFQRRQGQGFKRTEKLTARKVRFNG